MTVITERVRTPTPLSFVEESRLDFQREIIVIQEHTDDFVHEVDPWSAMTLEALRLEASEHRLFSNRNLLELGIGDGRNPRQVVTHDPTVRKITGIDIVQQKVAMARRNLSIVLDDTRIELDLPDATDAIEYLLTQRALVKKRELPLISGVGIACLPQSPNALTAADGYTLTPALERITAEWNPEWLEYCNRFGLTLNAAALDLLNEITTPNFNQIIVLSNRIPKQVREDIINQSGWTITRKYGSHKLTPVQQDPDTDISFTEEFDTGHLFYTRLPNGENNKPVFAAISAKEAEMRRTESLNIAQAESNRRQEKVNPREFLNVYHHLSIYVLEKAPQGYR